MQRVPVASSNIAAIGYHQETRILEVEFRNGTVYEYYDVPPAEHTRLMNAASHGTYFHAHIRDRYRCRRVR